MAELFTNTLETLVAYIPFNAVPVDGRTVVGSYGEAVAAAAAAVPVGSAGRYYYGMTIVVYENDTVTEYLIKTDNTLEPKGSQLVGDDKTIVIDNKVMSLKNFGKQYYHYHDADIILESNETYLYPDTMPEGQEGAFVKVGETYYQYTDGAWAVAAADPKTTAYYVLTQGWMEGLEPRSVRNENANGYEIAWYEPSSITMEGVSSRIAAMETTVGTLTDKVTKAATTDDVDAEKQRAEEAEADLLSKINANTESIDTLNADAETEGSVDYKIARALATLMENPDEAMNSINELVTWVNEHAGSALELSNNVTANAEAIRKINELLGTSLPETASATNVIDYIGEAVAAEKTRAEAAEAALSSRIDALKAITDTLGTAAYKSVEEIVESARESLAEDFVADVVASETNGNIVVNKNGELTEVAAYTLPTASSSVKGGVSVDGSTITADGDGKISVGNITSSKITDIDTRLETATNNAVDQVKEYADETFVASANIVDSNTVADSAEEASSTKVVSEELLLKLFTWKETM